MCETLRHCDVILFMFILLKWCSLMNKDKHTRMHACMHAHAQNHLNLWNFLLG